mmetsp:Transcript_5793/g.24197  ORF Transcript_5793/g.24197 Transcript_5793/m.24197 type:complete len:338 (+) Transcript_5793:258-1271(+)
MEGSVGGPSTLRGLRRTTSSLRRPRARAREVLVERVSVVARFDADEVRRGRRGRRHARESHGRVGVLGERHERRPELDVEHEVVRLFATHDDARRRGRVAALRLGLEDAQLPDAPFAPRGRRVECSLRGRRRGSRARSRGSTPARRDGRAARRDHLVGRRRRAVRVVGRCCCRGPGVVAGGVVGLVVGARELEQFAAIPSHARLALLAVRDGLCRRPARVFRRLVVARRRVRLVLRRRRRRRRRLGGLWWFAAEGAAAEGAEGGRGGAGAEPKECAEPAAGPEPAGTGVLRRERREAAFGGAPEGGCRVAAARGGRLERAEPAEAGRTAEPKGRWRI